MKQNTLKVISKLGKGQGKLSVDEIMAFLAEAPKITRDQVEAALAAKKKTTAKTPAWITDVQAEFKKVGWSRAKPGPIQLLEFANESGRLPKAVSIPKSVSVPSACKKIAAMVGEQEAKALAFALVEQKRLAGARS